MIESARNVVESIVIAFLGNVCVSGYTENAESSLTVAKPSLRGDRAKPFLKATHKNENTFLYKEGAIVPKGLDRKRAKHAETHYHHSSG